jgi:crotonobetainyl-CoA:carnitine CoA-transferase CaiB-like acyl-CoA transferase
MPFAILTALHYRDRTGKGQFVDFSMAEVQLTHMPRPIIDWVMNNRVDEPIGNIDADIAPTGCYPCAERDSWVVISVRTDAQWLGLKEAMDRPEWADDQRFDSAEGRIASRELIDARLREWSDAVLGRWAQAFRVPAGRCAVTMTANDASKERGYRWSRILVGQYRRTGPLFGLRARRCSSKAHNARRTQLTFLRPLGLTRSNTKLVSSNLISEVYVHLCYGR